MYSSTIIIQLQVLYWKTNYYYRSQFSLTAGGCRIKYPSFILIQACLHVPVCEHKRRTVTSKITLESLLVKKMIYPDSGATKLTNCHSKIVKSSLKVLPRNATAAGRWAELKIITNTNNSCKCCGDSSARKCDSVTVCSPLSGPVQRLRQPAIYANTDETLGATILDKTQRRNNSQIQGRAKPRLGNDTAAFCFEEFSVWMWYIFGARTQTFGKPRAGLH